MRIDVFCDIVDNYGDAGVCWRLVRRLAQTSTSQSLSLTRDFIRLFCNDLELLNKLAGGDAKALAQSLNIEILPWSDCMTGKLPDVVIETFACELPSEYLHQLKQQAETIVINLEYLSAESWVDSHHGLPSPSNGLNKYFFFPGFSEASGGLLQGDLADPDSAPPQSLLKSWALVRAPFLGKRISLFCYETEQMFEFLKDLDQNGEAVDVLVCFGQAQSLVSHWLNEDFEAGCVLERNQLRLIALPFVSQDDYDWLLTQCDLNIVRGEDSFVRAQWAGQPFIWQIYHQDDNAHHIKLNAFLSKYLANANPVARSAIENAMHGEALSTWFNHLDLMKEQAWAWRNTLCTSHKDGDLAIKLRTFLKKSTKGGKI